MVNKVIIINIGTKPTRICGRELPHPIYDELDMLVFQYGRKKVLEMFNAAMPHV
jgi:hypothetical protein